MDWQCIGTGLTADWRRIGGDRQSLSFGLAMDWQRIGTGLELDWRRLGNRLAPDWHNIGDGSLGIGSHSALDWHRIGDGLVSDWHLLGDRLAPDWHRIGTGLAMDWQWIDIRLVTDRRGSAVTQLWIGIEIVLRRDTSVGPTTKLVPCSLTGW